MQINCGDNCFKSSLSSVSSEVKKIQNIHKGTGSENIRKWMIAMLQNLDMFI